MAGTTVKKYDYDKVMSFTGSGGTLDTALKTIQDNAKELRTLIEECQELFHGKGNTSQIYKEYGILLQKLGWTSMSNGSIWNVCASSKDLINLMYNNAASQKALDDM